MSTDVTYLSDRSVKLLEARGADYLIEVFRPWDPQEQRWVDEDTFQFRFEAEDLLIGRDPNQNIANRHWEVLPGFEGVHQGSSEGLFDDCCCWLVDEALVEEPGQFGSYITLIRNVLDVFVNTDS